MSFWDCFTNKPHLIAAHRGATEGFPENTMIAFEQAVGMCDFIELDVACSKDGIVVVIHDDTLDRTSNVKDMPGFHAPYNVVDYTYEKLLDLDFGSTEKIPRLEEVLVLCKKSNTPLNIEIKDLTATDFHEQIVQKVIELVQKYEMENMVLISSFQHIYLKESFALAPKISTAALQEEKHPDNLISYLKDLQVDSYNIDDEICSYELIQRLNKAGFYVNVFTVNKKKDTMKLFEYGVKSIFTDIL